MQASIVKAKLVAESPVNMECRVKDIIALGDQGGAGHLIICDVLCMHIDENVLDGDRIDPHKIDLMGRMGRTFYVRASGNAVSSIYQPVTDLPVGFDALPSYISSNRYLTGNQIAMMAGLNALPPAETFVPITSAQLEADEVEITESVSKLLADNQVNEAFGLMVQYYEKTEHDLLCLEGATDDWSVALMTEGGTLGELSFGREKPMASFLVPAIRDVLQSSKTIKELDAIVISSGPGSYTGLRIVASTAKGLCLGSGHPLIAVPTLKSISWQGVKSQAYDRVIAIIDARRQDVFCAIYDNNGTEILAPTLLTLSESCFDPWLGARQWCVAMVCIKLIPLLGHLL